MGKLKIIRYILCAVFIVSVAAFVAAGCQNNEQKPGGTTVEDVKLSLRQTEAELYLGETLQLEVFTEPQADLTYDYFTDNEQVATVGNEGLVTAVGVGKTKITVSAGDFTKAYLNVTVSQKVDSVYKIKIPVENANLFAGDKFDMNAYVVYGAAKVENAEINYKSSDESVAQVNDGVITAVGEGSATVTLSYSGEYGSASASFSVKVLGIYTVNAEIENKKEYYIPGETADINIVSVKKENGDEVEVKDEDIVYTSLNEDVATVSEGVITAVAAGTATIGVSYVGGGSFNLEIEVAKKISTAQEFIDALFEGSGIYVLTKNIDLAGISSDFGVTFSGILDGNGYTVSNGTFSGAGWGYWQNGALINVLEKDAAVKNIGFVNFNHPNQNQDGGFINTNYGTIENVFLSRIGMPWECGGLIGGVISGRHEGTGNYGTIKNVVIDCSETKSGNVCALVALSNYGSVENVYALGTGGQPLFLDDRGTSKNVYEINACTDEILRNAELPQMLKNILARNFYLFYSPIESIGLVTGESSAVESAFSVDFGGTVDYALQYTVEDNSIAAIDGDKIVAKAKGGTIATVCLKYGELLVDTFDIVVKVGEVKPSFEGNVLLDINRPTEHGGMLAVDLKDGVKLSKGELEDYEVSYRSSDPTVAIVNAEGVVSAGKVGKADIYMTVDGVEFKLTTAEVRSWTELTKENFINCMTYVTAENGWCVVGNYYLSGDIDLEGQGANFGAPFNGILDGNGYAVKNATFTGSAYGNQANGAFFGDILEGASVKNIAFVDFKHQNVNQGGGFFNSNHGTIENVYVKRIGNPDSYGGLIGGERPYWDGSAWATYQSGTGNYGTVKNVVIDTSGADNGPAGLIALSNWESGVIENAYAVKDEFYDTISGSNKESPLYYTLDSATPPQQKGTSENAAIYDDMNAIVAALPEGLLKTMVTRLLG